MNKHIFKVTAAALLLAIIMAVVPAVTYAAGATKISENGLSLIKTFEGCSLTAYKNAGEAYYTIGWGHYGPDVTADMKITQAQADKMLVDDMAEYENAVIKFANQNNRAFTQNEFDALVSFTYQNGCYSWSTHPSYDMYQYMAKQKKYTEDELCRTFMSWSKSGSTSYTPGLVKRRLAECAIFLTPDSTPYELWEMSTNVNFRQSYTTSSASYGYFRDYALIVVTDKKSNQGYNWGQTRYYIGNETTGSIKTGWTALNYATKRFGSLTAKPTTAPSTPKPTEPSTTKPTEPSTSKPTEPSTPAETTRPFDKIIYPFRDNPNMGDVNCDGSTNLLDLLSMRKHLAKFNMELISEKDAENYPTDKIVARERADINNDGSINLLDLIMIRKHLVKIEVYYGVYEN